MVSLFPGREITASHDPGNNVFPGAPGDRFLTTDLSHGKLHAPTENRQELLGSPDRASDQASGKALGVFQPRSDALLRATASTPVFNAGSPLAPITYYRIFFQFAPGDTGLPTGHPCRGSTT